MLRAIPSIAAVLWLIPAVAVAQTPKEPSRTVPAAPKAAAKSAPANAARPDGAVSAAPERTTASFGDWVMRCEDVAATRICEVAHLIMAQGQSAPVAQVAIGRQAPNEGNRLTVVLPPNVSIVSRPHALLAKAEAAPIDLAWQRCMPGGCFASAPLGDETIAQLSAQTEPGRIVFKDAAEREVVLPVSFRGLAQSLAALAK